MISHEYKCIFVEVPKTGSTSIRDVIGYPDKPHLDICQIASTMDGETFDAYFKFGFVRNPWDRIVSLYERRQGVELRDKMSFDEFVEWCSYSSSTCVHPSPHRYQLDWFVDSRGEVIVDFIGRFERLRQDWSFVAEKLGIRESIPHKNQNPHKRHYTEYYTKKTRDIVAKRFAVDVEYFNYRFSP